MNRVALSMSLSLAGLLVASCAAPPTPVQTAGLGGAKELAPLGGIMLDGLSIAAPPNAAEVSQGLAEVVTLQAGLTDAQRAAIARWNGEAAPLVWDDVFRERVAFWRQKNYPPRNARAWAMVSAAMYDALLAVRQARASAAHATPAAMSSTVKALAPDSGAPTYPSESAAIAYSAATAAGYVLPEERDAMLAKAVEASESRLWAGLNVRADIEAGRALGTAVAERLIANRRTDGADLLGPIPGGPNGLDGLKFLLPRPEDGAGTWRHKVPTEPTAGTWQPWLMASSRQFRLPEPPRPHSVRFEADLKEVLEYWDWANVPLEWRARADKWAKAAPANDWNVIALAALREQKASNLKAARTLAWLNVIQADCTIACWDTKYTWYQPRPDNMQAPTDASLPWLTRSPAHPSYPSGHSTFSAGAAVYLSALFPEKRESFLATMEEASISRLYGGIHYRTDLTDGKKLGLSIASYALEKYNAETAPE